MTDLHDAIRDQNNRIRRRPTSQTYRPTIVFTNGYPDADATVQDAVERVERLREATGVWGYGALLEAEAELRDLGVAQ